MRFRIVYNGSDKPLRPGLEQEALIESKSIIRGKNTFITSIQSGLHVFTDDARGFRTLLLPPTSEYADTGESRRLWRLLVMTSEINQFSAKHFFCGTHGIKLCCCEGDIEGR